MLTTKQKAVLDFIRQRRVVTGISPSYREIRQALGLKAVSTVSHHVQALIAAGHLTNVKGYHGKRSLLPVTEAAVAGTVTLPLLGRIAADRPIEAIADNEMVTVPPALAGEGHYSLKVQGDSMIGDGVLDGDVVIVRQRDTANHREMVVALINGEATLKRLARQGDSTELHPANPEYPVITVHPEDDFRIQGVAIEVIRRY